MNKLLPLVVFAVALAGCRTPVTPEHSWADYGHYYAPTGEQAAAPAGPATVRTVKSKEASATVESLKAQGYVVLGSFKIEDGTDISYNAVMALAQKLNASEAVWSSVDALPKSATVLANPGNLGIAGTDNVQMAMMNASMQDQSLTEQVYERHHTIWMLGKKAK